MMKRIMKIIVPLLTCAVLFAQAEPERIHSIFYMKAKTGRKISLKKGWPIIS